MRNKFADTLYELSKEDDRICALVADISPAGSMVKFREEFPERFVNTGVAEQSMIGIAAGMALQGLRPFCYTIATFSLFRPYEMVRVDLGYQNLPVTIIGMGAGVVYSTLGGTHHSMEDISIASSIPNMTVLAPCDPEEMKKAVLWCVKESKGPVYMRMGKAGEPNLTEKALDPFIVGKIRYIKRGKDVAILSYGLSIDMCIKAAKKIEEKGQTVSIISVHTIKPIDIIGIKEVLNNHKEVLVVEEHVPHGGLGSRVKEIAWDNKVKCELKTLSLKDQFIHFYGTHGELLAKHGLSVETIVNLSST